MKVIVNPVTGKTFKMGRRHPTNLHKGPKFGDMLRLGILPNITPPLRTTYRTASKQSLTNPYLNTDLEDCVVASGFHARGNTSFNSGQGVEFSNSQVIQNYSAIGGYNPNAQLVPDPNNPGFFINPTDNGCDEITALTYWRNTGFPDGVKIEEAISIDSGNLAEARLALYLCENLIFCVDMPDGWVNPMPSGDGFWWHLQGSPDEDNGHSFLGVDLVPEGVVIGSWGMIGIISNAAMMYYANMAQQGQLFTILTPDIVFRITQKSPAGYDINTLIKYLDTFR